jgi:hypothetical protein
MNTARASAIQAVSSPMLSASSTALPGVTARASLRRWCGRPLDCRAAATASKRCGWRGTSTSSQPGWRASRARCAASTAASSPSCVLAATHSGRSPTQAWNCASRAAWSGASGVSNLRLPVTTVRAGAAPSARKRSRTGASCTSSRSSAASRVSVVRGKRA